MSSSNLWPTPFSSLAPPGRHHLLAHHQLCSLVVVWQVLDELIRGVRDSASAHEARVEQLLQQVR
jgi:hypothetical protein